jgi:nucleoside-diphosphate-sugar epimerase
MKVFVAGATGAIGGRAVEELLAAGHEVTAAARTAAKAERLRAAGAMPVTADLFDAAAARAAVAGHDAVVNLATHIPPASKAVLPRAWKENDHIRRELSRTLVDAALASGAKHYVQESIVFTYPSMGDAWIGEDVPIAPAKYVRSTADAEARARRFTEGGGAGVVLRFGQFYAADTGHTRDMVKMVRKGRAPAFGGDGYASSIHLDDAATAVAAALTVPAGIYNVVEDEPVTRRVFFDVLADALGVPHPKLLPAWLGRLTGSVGETFSRSQRVSNRRLREASGWAPRYPSVREGWPAVVAELPPPE